jgi:hypothetical protein
MNLRLGGGRSKSSHGPDPARGPPVGHRWSRPRQCGILNICQTSRPPRHMTGIALAIMHVNVVLRRISETVRRVLRHSRLSCATRHVQGVAPGANRVKSNRSAATAAFARCSGGGNLEIRGHSAREGVQGQWKQASRVVALDRPSWHILRFVRR